MKNLTIHRLAFSVLMMCVLMFGVQSVADALTFGTSRSGDYNVVSIQETFTITFSATLGGNTTRITNNGRLVSDDRTTRIDSSGFPVADIAVGGQNREYRTFSTQPTPPTGGTFVISPFPSLTTQGSAGAATAPYYISGSSIVDSTGQSVRVQTGTGAADDRWTYTTASSSLGTPAAQLSVEQRYHYNEEAIGINVQRNGIDSTELTLTKSGTLIPSAIDDTHTSPLSANPTDTTASLYEGAEDTNRRLSGSTTLTGTANEEGLYKITISDITEDSDRPSDAPTREFITFTIFVLQNVNDSRISTIASTGDNGFSDGIAPQHGIVNLSVTLTGDNSTFARVEFEVFRGPGRLYEDKDEDRKPDKSPSNKLTTFTNNLGTDRQASVVLVPNRGTSHIRAWVSGNPPGTNTKSIEATYVFEYPQVKKISGDSPQQTGPPSSRLEKPFVAQLVDSTGRTAIPGEPITLRVAGDGALLVKDPNFPDNLYADTFPTVSTVTTNDQGRISFFFVLGTDATQAQTVTATYGSGPSAVSAMFEASISGSATGRTPQHIGKVAATDGQRADQYGVLEKPLTVIVRDQYGDLLPDAIVEFEAREGGTLSPPDNNQGEPGTVPTTGSPDILDRRRDIQTNPSGEASVRYTAPADSKQRTVTATLEEGSRSSVTFTINGTGSTNTPTTRTPYLSFSPSSLTGAPGQQRSFTVSAFDRNNRQTNTVVNLSSSGVSVPATVNSGQSVSITLPSSSASISASASGYTSRTLTVNVQAIPDEIVKVSGDSPVQTGEPGAQLSSAFVVRVEDSSNNPIPQQTVTFRVTGGGGSLSSTSVTTDSSGEARATLTLGSSAGTNTVEASVSGVSSIVTFTATAEQASVANRLEIEDGNNQTGELNRLLPSPLIVQLLDQNGDPIQGITIEFEITQGSGRLSPRTARTDSSGFAEVNFTPSSTGNIQVRASVRGIDTISPVTFNISGGSPPDAIVLVSGNNQSGRPGARLANPLVVEVIDEDDAPVSGVTVAFRVTGGGGSVSPTSATTNNNGRAQTRLTLGDDPGENTVVASVSGLTDRVTFKATSGMQVHLAASRRPVMYWISSAEGKLYRLAGDAVESLAPNLTGITNIAVDAANNVLYLSVQTGPNKGEIRRATLDGGNVRTLKQITAVPRGITVDSTGDTLYWANSRGRIQSMPTAGSAKLTNVLENLRNPTIVISNGHLYWTESIGRIRRISLTDTQPTIQNIATGLGEPLGLAIAKGKVYWIERAAGGSGSLNRSNLDGSNRQALKTFASGVPTSLAVDSGDNKLYWTKGAGKLQRSNLAGKFVRDVASGLMGPRGIALSVSVSDGTPVRSSPGGPDTEQANNPQTTYSIYDINEDGAVNNADTRLVAADVGNSGAAIKNKRADVDGSGTVDVTDLILVLGNLDDDVAAPAIDVDVKALDVDFDRVQEQVEVLLASGDRSIAAQRALLYLQHLLASARPDETVLLANYPNPFNPETWIPYHLSDSTEVRVNIYDAQGTLVRELTLGHQTAGYYTSRSRAAYWDGKNALGERVASGIYFYQLQTDTVSPMRKMVILK